jgi:hypothetical protein
VAAGSYQAQPGILGSLRHFPDASRTTWGQQMKDRFDSAWQKIDRARKHADDLDAEVTAFWATEPCEVETPTGSGSYRVTRMEALPESVPLIAGDAAHNIRSALDHFACAAVPRPDRETAFPVWNASGRPVPTAAQWRKAVERRLAGASPGLIAALLELEAWKTGRDSLLWAIHELDRVDKHRLLISIAVANTRIGLDGDGYALTIAKRFGGYALDQPLFFEPVKWTPLTQGAELLNVQDELGLDASETIFTFDVKLGEPELLRDQSAVIQLRTLADLAENVIRGLASLA